jgi:LmbE family N-acetylglucosaminyl deacetylase
VVAKRKPLTVWIAGVVTLLAIVTLAVAVWFDRLFEAPTAKYTPSLVQHSGVRSILAVFAHPDDETLASGALADAAGRDGIEVRTITLTRGEKGYAEPHISRPEDLPVVRESELRRYGYALGIDHQELWDYPDGGLSNLSDGEIVDRIVTRIREEKPEAVLTFDLDGGYNGNPDHQAAGAMATKAVRAAFDLSFKPELGALHQPKYLVYVVPPRRALQVLGGPELRLVAATQPEPTLAVPAARTLRLLGWKIHESQHLDRAYPLPGWLLFDFWDKEHYVILGSESIGSSAEPPMRRGR